MAHRRKVLHWHGFCGSGGGAKGFNKGRAQFKGMEAEFVCLGGVDSSPAAIEDFNRIAGVRGTVLDMFSREQYRRFHGHEPPPGWREATTDDIRRSAQYLRPHIVFLSAPCKGFSGLLAQSLSEGDRYQALNELTLRGVWLMCEAWSDDPPEFVLFENVPRIMTRGRVLLDRITALLRHYGYAVAETTHDCGELGGLAQSRKRFLLVARHVAKVPPFLYQPAKRPLRAVGDVLGKMPLPGDLVGGPMHRLPKLHWKTWVRLAFVEAGSDWRSLNRLAVEDGFLRDYAIAPAFNGAYGVNAWEQTSDVVTGNGRPASGRFSVADPRVDGHPKSVQLGVRRWEETAACVKGDVSVGTGPYAVADPRFDPRGNDFSQYGVHRFDETMGSVINVKAPGQGRYSVADPRYTKEQGARFNNIYRVVRFDQTSPAVTAGAGPTAGALAVADPRRARSVDFPSYGVLDFGKPAGAVAGESLPSNGRFAVADPRTPWKEGTHENKLRVGKWTKFAPTVIGTNRGPGSGALAVADPRPGNDPAAREHYRTSGNFGVIPWDRNAYAVTANGRHDNGHNNVADPRLPRPNDKLACLIVAEDNTWHRPFTTLELAALQSLIEPEEHLELFGTSDSDWRERIGNMVPPDAAQAVASVMGMTLLLAWSGETFILSSAPVWVRPIVAAIQLGDAS